MKPSILSIALGLFMIVTIMPNQKALAEQGQQYLVTITNITQGQVITPPVVFSHDDTFQLFTLGEPALPELVVLAEDGGTGDLLDFLATSSGVYDFTAHSDVLPPGTSVTLDISTSSHLNQISAVGMLASTNDGFFAARGINLPAQRDRIVYAFAYDAGSETNSESCAYIPGPPCGNPNVRDTADAEGFVHIHGGIHGIGDLDPATYDWRNPVVEIRIERVR